MDISDCQIGMRVRYSKGIKGPIVGKVGIVDSLHEYDREMVLVIFDDDGLSACWSGNLEEVK